MSSDTHTKAFPVRQKYFLVALVLFMLIMLTLYKVGYRKNLNYNFSGLVQSVKYDDNKSTPTILVNDEEYYLSANINFDRKIGAGDSIVKRKGEMIFRLIKKGTKEIIVFKDE